MDHPHKLTAGAKFNAPKMTVFIALSVFGLYVARAQKPQQPAAASKVDIKAGGVTYARYCASCHGKSGKGDGPAADALKNPPSDLTTLTKRFEGKFPRGYVSAVLIFGKRFDAHGSEDMPVWGAKFRKIDPEKDRSGQKHIDDLVAYIESFQMK